MSKLRSIAELRALYGTVRTYSIGTNQSKQTKRERLRVYFTVSNNRREKIYVKNGKEIMLRQYVNRIKLLKK